MNIEIENRRNEWVAQQLGVQKVYRDDNCFVDDSDPNGVILAFVTIASNGDEVLIRADGTHGFQVPSDLTLGVTH